MDFFLRTMREKGLNTKNKLMHYVEDHSGVLWFILRVLHLIRPSVAQNRASPV